MTPSYFGIANSQMLGWTSDPTWGSLNTAIGRNADGVAEINNGTAGQYRDLYAGNITLQSSGIITGSGRVPTGGTTGQVLKKIDGTNYNYSWQADATGGAGGTPSGPATAVQFEDAGAFGGDAGLTYNKTTDSLTAVGMITAGSGTPWNTPALNAGVSGTGMASAGALGILLSIGNSEIIFNGSSHEVRYRSDGIVGWAGNTDNYNNAPDTAFARVSAGTVEINNGTLGQYRDLSLRTLNLGAAGGIYMQGGGGGIGAHIVWSINGAIPLHTTQAYGTIIDTTLGFMNGYNTGVAPDVALAYSAANTIKVTNGAAGTGTITGNGTVPTGGASGDVLVKNSATNYDVGWTTAAAGGNVSNSGTPVAGQVAMWTDATHIQGLTANLDYSNSSVTSQSLSTSDVYLAGSSIVVPAGGFKAKAQYRCRFDVVKSAGTGTIALNVRIGTLGTTGDSLTDHVDVSCWH